ncbi:ATP-binding protein [bacterium]
MNDTNNTILIVEDEKLIARDLQKLLEMLGFQVPATVSSSKEALNFIKNRTPDLILMDIKLEGPVDGIETAKQIKDRIDVPVVFLTALPDQEYINRAKEINPAGYLLKPFQERELEITIHLALHKHKYDKKIKAKESQYQQLFENVPIGLYHASSDGTFLDVNQTLISMLGFESKADLLKQTIDMRYFNSEDHINWQKEIQTNETLQGIEIQWKKKDGTYIWMLESAQSIHDDEGKIICFEGAVQDLTAQKETELQLKTIKVTLEKYIIEMKEYARIASHDLQEPLRQISGYAQLLEKRLQGSMTTDVSEFISNITEGTDYMQGLLQDFVDYTHILTKNPEKTDFSMEAMIDSVISRFNPDLLMLNAKIDYDPLPDIIADPNMIQLLIEHLIENAIKYRSDTTPHIHISTANQPNGHQFTIQDNGIGIPAAYQSQIFQLFKRLHNKHNYPGTGLGLAICKQIVKKHGGQIWVKSGKEKGASFSFTIQTEQILPQ